MNSKRYLIFILLFSVGCDEAFLNRPPLDKIGSDSYWTTTNDLKLYMLQFYPLLPAHGLNNNGMPTEDAPSDNLILQTPNVILNGERVITAGRWTGEWRNIREVNIFFDNYRRCDDPFNTYQHYLGEAHFFRAWFYFELLSKYGDIPWYSTELQLNSDAMLMSPRLPRTQVVDSILADIDHAVTYLDSRSATGNNRLNKEAALAFKSRVALFEGTWQKYHAGTPFGTPGTDPAHYFRECVEAAEELASEGYLTGIYSPGNTENDYYELFGLDNMSAVEEVLLYRAYNAADGMGNDIQNITTNTATAFMGVTWSLISSYLDRDGQPYDYLGLALTTKGNAFLTTIAEHADPRLKATIWTPGELVVERTGATFEKPYIDRTGRQLNPTGFQVKKFSNPSSPGAGQPTGAYSETGYIIFRYGEVLLNYAEAIYELNGIVAYPELNRLRNRVGMPDFEVLPQSSDPSHTDYGYTISDELYAIRRERRVELALEGRREADYRRWAAHALFQGQRPKGYPFEPTEFPNYNPPVDENGLIDYLKPRLPSGFAFRENQDYLDDIPQDELALNPNLTQNPGW